MLVRANGQPHRIYTRDPSGPLPRADGRKASCRLPSGHPEAFLEAFANIYTAAYDDMVARAGGQKFDGADSLYPNVADGVDGMNFITQCVASSHEGWAVAVAEACGDSGVNHTSPKRKRRVSD